MAEFTIISKTTGTGLYTGALKFVDSFLKPGYLEFHDVNSASPIAFSVGDYVDYPRTGLRYKLYANPKVTQQATAQKYGGAFAYEGVQFFDNSKQLEFAEFIDLVPEDNEVHFSTRNAVSFRGKPADLAARIEACLNYWFPDENWEIRVISGLNPSTDAELIEILNTEADFSVAGVSCQGALERMYEIWNRLGWSYTYETGSGSGYPKNVITIGAPNKRVAANTTPALSYGYGNGLTSLERAVSNRDEIGTRLYVYGSMRNMLGNYYREQNIKDAESIDIEHLMLPIAAVPSRNYDGWGMTDNLPDARLAYLENETALEKFGLIPKYAYFDGSNENYPEIFPSIEGVTIGDVIDIKQQLSDLSNVPNLNIYSRTDRIDEILSAANPQDSGEAADNGKQYNETVNAILSAQSSAINWQDSEYTDILLGTVAFINSGELELTFAPSGICYVETLNNAAVRIDAILRIVTPGGDITDIPCGIPRNPTLIGSWRRYTIDLPEDAVTIAGNNAAGAVSIYLRLSVYMDEPSPTTEYNARQATSPIGVSLTSRYSLGKKFTVSVPQIGFNIDEYAEIGEGKVLSMKSGMCAARDFIIDSCDYVPATDSWTLTLWRCKDEDTGLLYPNADYPINFYDTPDRFVLLDIAMPELYRRYAELRLLDAGLKLLKDIGSEKYLYVPRIDAKKIISDGIVLRAGMYMHLTGAGIVDAGEDYSIIDSLTIDEYSDSIPTYSVTLREKKGAEWTETIGAQTTGKSSVSVRGGTNEKDYLTKERADRLYQALGEVDSFFEKYPFTNNGVTAFAIALKDTYAGLFSRGFVSQYGLSIGSGGGGLITAVHPATDLGSITSESLTETFSAYAIQQIYDLALQGGGNPINLNGAEVSGTAYFYAPFDGGGIGQVLIAGGDGVAPSWVNAASLNVGYATSAGYAASAGAASSAASADYATTAGSATKDGLGRTISSTYLTSHQDISGKADKVNSATSGHFASLNSSGNLVDSGYKPSDFLTSHQDISGKADKVLSATNGHFAGLDSNGNLTDSGYKASDFLTPASLSGYYMTLATDQTVTGKKTFTDGNLEIRATVDSSSSDYWAAYYTRIYNRWWADGTWHGGTAWGNTAIRNSICFPYGSDPNLGDLRTNICVGHIRGGANYSYGFGIGYEVADAVNGNYLQPMMMLRKNGDLYINGNIYPNWGDTYVLTSGNFDQVAHPLHGALDSYMWCSCLMAASYVKVGRYGDSTGDRYIYFGATDNNYIQFTLSSEFAFTHSIVPAAANRNLGSSSSRWATVYGTAGDLSGNLSVAGSATIIGDLRLTTNQKIYFGSGNNAHYLEVVTIDGTPCLHTDLPIVSEDFISQYGLSPEAQEGEE